MLILLLLCLMKVNQIWMEDDDIEYNFVMPNTCCNDFAQEDNDTSYDLENLFGTCLEEYDN